MGPRVQAAAKVVALGVTLLALAAGCRSVPTQACIDINEALAHAQERCGADYATAYAADVNAYTSGHGCGNARMLRDKESFYMQCIPWVEGLTCAQLSAPTIVEDPSCVNQITIYYYTH